MHADDYHSGSVFYFVIESCLSRLESSKPPLNPFSPPCIVPHNALERSVKEDKHSWLYMATVST